MKDVADIAAFVSERVCHTFPRYSRVARVLEGEPIAIEVTPGGAEPVGLDIDGFWPEGCSLSPDRQRALFWQYHRSRGCDEYAAALAVVLKGLADSGVRLGHNGRPVVDVLVLNTTEFDVADILAARGENAALSVHDRETDVTLPVIATHEAMERMIDLGDAFCARLGIATPPRESCRATMKQHRPESYAGTVPHWWVSAVVVDEQRDGAKEYSMVHLDICGAAYDASALVKAPGSGDAPLVPLQVFSTPEYAMLPNRDGDLSHKLTMKAFLSERGEQHGFPQNRTRLVLQPKSVRHFRCYHRDNTSTIEVTPLATFVERSALAGDPRLEEMANTIRSETVLQLPVGSRVAVCNLQSRPDLNGRSGVVHMRSKKVAEDRIAVLIEGLKDALSLKANCIRLPSGTNQYESLEEKLREYDEMTSDLASRSATPDQQRRIPSSLPNDPAVAKVMAVMQTGQMGFTSFGDPEFQRGVELLLRPPLNTVLPKPVREIMQSGFELSKHPKANDAIKIIKILRTSKERLAQEQPDAISNSGGVRVDPGSNMERIATSVVNKIRNDEGLLFVFERLEVLGLYRNPTKWFGDL